MSKFKTQLILQDLHIPWWDIPFVETVLQIGREAGVTHVIMPGDLVDFASLSLKFHESPKDKRLTTAEHEIRTLYKFLSRVTELFPRAGVDVLWGNHDWRYETYLSKHAKALFGVHSLTGTIQKYVACERLRFFDYPSLVPYGKLWVCHGEFVRKSSGATARAHLDKYGVSVLHGHTHRMGSHYHTNGKGTLGAWENGCCCRRDIPWASSVEDWQQGFSIVHNDFQRRFEVRQYVRTGGHLLVDGVVVPVRRNGLLKGV